MTYNLTKYISTLIGCCVFANTLFSNPTTSFSDPFTPAFHQVAGSDLDSISGEPSHVINFNVYEQNDVIYCNFRTEFKCRSYAIEGRQGQDDEFRSLFYCDDKLCVDSREWVDISFANNEYPFTHFRIKTVLMNGNVHYSQTRFVQLKAQNEVEIVNSVVSAYLYFRFNAVGKAAAYNYSIAGINGELIRNDEPASEGFVNLENLPEGFYIISFKSSNGKIYHYKFLKTANL